MATEPPYRRHYLDFLITNEISASGASVGQFFSWNAICGVNLLHPGPAILRTPQVGKLEIFQGGQRRGREQHSLTTQSKEAPNIDVRSFLGDHTDRVTRAAYLLVY